MKKIVLLLVGLVVLGGMMFIGSQLSKETIAEDAIIIGMSGGYKPYTFTDEAGELVGFEVDTWHEIGQRINREIAFQTADFSGLFGMLDSGKIDTISNQITVNEKRLEKYEFSLPYVYYGAQLVTKTDNDSIVDLKSLIGKKVGVSLGSNYEEMIKTYDVDHAIEVITYESYQGSLQDVALGRIDAVLNDRLAGLTAIHESGLDLMLAGEPIEMMFNAFPYTTDQEPELILAINEAIEAMHADGTFEEISLKWFPVNITEK